MISLRATPRTRITALLRVQARRVITVGTGKHRRHTMRMVTLYQAPLQLHRGRQGQITARLLVSYRSSRPVHAVLVVTAHSGCGSATRTVAIIIQLHPHAMMHPHR